MTMSESPTPSLKRKADESTELSPDKKDKISRRKEKKARNIAAQALVDVPTFQFNLSGFSSGKRIGVSHIRDLALHLCADANQPSWMKVANKRNISHTTMVLIPGITPELLGFNTPSLLDPKPFSIAPVAGSTSKLPVFQQLFSFAVPVRAPGDKMRLHSALHHIMQSPLPEQEKKRKEKERERLIKSAKGKAADVGDVRGFVLRLDQLEENDYPLPSYFSRLKVGDKPIIDADDDLGEVLSRDDAAPVASSSSSSASETEGTPLKSGWVETPLKPGDAVLGEGGDIVVLAVDCEMCMTEKGTVLARVSVIDVRSGTKVYDELVKPEGEVTDYLTQWSGITPEQLATATLSLLDVQTQLLSKWITSSTVLVGHSLESDLSALKLRHPWVIDTALLYTHPRGRPYKPALKWLAQKWLGKEIQTGRNSIEGGHDPEEDARTAGELLQMKVRFGEAFGAGQGGDETESIFERILRAAEAQLRAGAGKNGNPNAPVPIPASRKPWAGKTAVIDYGNPKGWFGSKATTAIGATNDDEILEGLLANVAEHDFTFGRFTELSNALGWNGLIDPITKEPIISATDAPRPDLEATIQALNTRLLKLHESLPKNSSLIILTGNSDPREMIRLNSKRQKYEKALKASNGKLELTGLAKEELWMQADERDLEAEVAKARDGLGFFCVKL